MIHVALAVPVTSFAYGMRIELLNEYEYNFMRQHERIRMNNHKNDKFFKTFLYYFWNSISILASRLRSN